MTSNAQWPVVQLDEVADDITVGHVGPMATEYVSTGVPFLRSQNVEPFRVSLDDVKFVGRDFHARLTKSALRPGDVVIVRTGRPGSAAVIPPELPVANCADLVIVRPGPKLDAHFVMYFINSVGSGHVASHLVGAVQQHFNVGSARTLRVPLPPLPEQLRIAQTLRALDERIELNRRMNRTIESISRALFRSWFVESTLAVMPAGWSRVACSEEFSITMGQSPPGSTYNARDKGTPFFQGCRDFGGRYPARRVFCTAPSRFAQRGDTLVSVRAPVGALNQAVEHCCIGRGLAAVRHRTGARHYTFEAMRSLDDRFLDFESGGTVFGALSGKAFKSLRVLAPPADVIAAFESAVDPLMNLHELKHWECLRLGRLRDALLPSLLSGALVLQ